MRLKDSQSRNPFLWNITTGSRVSLPVTSTSTSALTLPLLYPTRNRHFVLIPKLISLLSVARYGSINPLQFNHPRYNSISGDTTTCRSICDNLRELRLLIRVGGLNSPLASRPVGYGAYWSIWLISHEHMLQYMIQIGHTLCYASVHGTDRMSHFTPPFSTAVIP